MASSPSLTTLQLAERIVGAVLDATSEADEPWAVLRVLHEEGCWFCRLIETETETVVEPLPQLRFEWKDSA